MLSFSSSSIKDVSWDHQHNDKMLCAAVYWAECLLIPPQTWFEILLQCHSCWQRLSLEFVSTYYCSLWTWVLPLVNVYGPFMSVYSTSGLLIICIMSLFLHSTMYPYRHCNALFYWPFHLYIDIGKDGNQKCSHRLLHHCGFWLGFDKGVLYYTLSSWSVASIS